MFRIEIHMLIGILLILGPRGLLAEEETDSITLNDLYQMLQEQQKTINDQNKALQDLSTKLEQVTRAQAQVLGTDIVAPTDKQIARRQQAAAKETFGVNTTSMPANVLTAGEFPGSIRMPGTNMAAKVCGFVRLGVVGTFEPIGSDDRFIVGTTVVSRA